MPAAKFSDSQCCLSFLRKDGFESGSVLELNGAAGSRDVLKEKILN